MSHPTSRTDSERLADLIQKMGAEPREAKFDEQGHLIELNLAGLNLTSLPPEIGQFTHLEVLLLGQQLYHTDEKPLLGNQLSSLPADIGRLVNLKRLDLRSNQFTELPLVVTYLTYLRYLSFSENNLKTLPDEITRLTSLQELYLSRNKFTVFPSQIIKLRNLLCLTLTSNRLTTLPSEIAQLLNLQWLYLWGNRLTTIPSEISELKNLNKLHLGGNQLAILPSEVGKLTELKSLGLDNLGFTAFPSEITQLINLKTLYFENNNLTALPPKIAQLTNLQVLDLKGNPLRTPPPEIVERGTADILDFMRDLGRGSVMRYEAKLIILGEGGTGKSSLLRSLRGEGFVEGLATTHGIAVKAYEFGHPEKEEERIRLNVWDFGGQQIYHTTHQFFMTQRSLYLLVWNARGDTAQARLDEWLRNIQVLAPEAPVLLVGTHVEGRPLDFNYARYKEAYPQVVGAVGVSNREGTGIEDLKAIIAREAVNLPLMEQEWPKSWVDAEKELDDMRDYYLTLADYTRACTAQGVTARIAESALGGYLHDLGKMLYFQDDDMLADFVVLKPNWLTRAISRVLDDEMVLHNDGLLPHADFSRIWDVDEHGKPYPRHLYPRFLRLMERFLISFRLESDTPNQQATHSLVPLRLPHTPPTMPLWEAVLPDAPRIQMRFRLRNFVPPGIMSWFIVLTHTYTQGLHWREGVRLHYNEHQAEVVLNPSSRELWLRVRGPAPSNFFNILQHTINERILKRFFIGLQYTRQVPCTCHLARDEGENREACPYFHDYERLVKRIKRGILKAECGDSFEYVSVPELLEGIHYSTNNRFEAKLEQIHETVKEGHLELSTTLNQMQMQLSQGFEQLKRDFTRLWNHQMSNLNAECPNIFIIMPGDRRHLHPKNLFNTEHTLYLLCQHAPQPHIVSGEAGYSITEAKEWFGKMAPWLKQLMDYLRYIPKGKAIAEAYDEDMLKQIETSLNVFEAALEVAPPIYESEEYERFNSSDRTWHYEVEGAALRALHRFLKQVDEQQHWCGLHKTLTNDGNIFWLCDEHRELYRVM